MKRRLKALKNLQLETTKVEAEFFKEVHALECKYQARYQPFYEKVINFFLLTISQSNINNLEC